MKVRQKFFWFNDAHDKPLPRRAIFVDGFAGGGGASVGIERALGRQVDVAINHDKAAIAMHMANHPKTKHYCENIWTVDPVAACEGRQVQGAWFSPDCTHFSKARGKKPVRKTIRGLAWVVVRWAELVKPRVMFIENVEEFLTWGPVDRKTGKPIKEKAGVTLQLWVWKLRELGYEVEWRVLQASDFGAPTTRKRLFIVCRCDGKPIVWPEPTHGGPKQIAKDLRTRGHSRRRPWATAAEIIDWSIPCPSIFLTPAEAKREGCIRPLADKTLKRIAEGIRRYVIETSDPFIVRTNHGGDHFRGQSIRQPLGTMVQSQEYAVVDPVITPFTTGCGGRAGQSPPSSIASPLNTVTAKADRVLVSPSLAPFITSSAYSKSSGRGKYIYGMDEPIRTLTSTNDKVLVAPLVSRMYGASVGSSIESPIGTTTMENKTALVAPILSTYYGPRPGDGGHRGRTLDFPLATQGTENRFALVSAFIAKHFGGMVGIPADRPFPTVTTIGTQNQLVSACLIKNNHGEKQWFGANEPCRTIVAQGTHHAVVTARMEQVRAFLFRYFGSGGQWSPLTAPCPTITTKDRLALGIVRIQDDLWQIVDIGMRMLTPRELFRAQGFPSNYTIDVGLNGKPATKSEQVARCGNSVSPHPAEALVRANLKGVAL